MNERREDDLRRIGEAVEQSRRILQRFTPGAVAYRLKAPGDPVTGADLEVNEFLQRSLPRTGERWLSEETADDASRLDKPRVWIVDPVDGTRQFVAGVPEWCVSIALIEEGRAVAGGLCNPAAGQTLVGAAGIGLFLNGEPCRTRSRDTLVGAEILASRSEVERGEWERFEGAPFRIRPVGSVAYKLGLVAAGLADATWTLTPKHEWDVAAGVALVQAGGGVACALDGTPISFNRKRPRIDGLLAASAALAREISSLLDHGRDGPAAHAGA